MVLLALVGLYFGTWPHFRNAAIRDVKSSTVCKTTVVVPWLLRTQRTDNITVQERYHLWAFGTVIRLPYAREYSDPNPLIMVVQPRIIFEADDDEEFELMSRM